MSTMSKLAPVGLALYLFGCGEEPKPPPTIDELAAQKCPKINIDKLAGDWIITSGDPKTRLRIFEKDGGYYAHYVPGFFQKFELKGTKKGEEVVFDEVPMGLRVKQVGEGKAPAMRLTVLPYKKMCSLQVKMFSVEKGGAENMMNSYEMLEFPAEGEGMFSYAPPKHELFLGSAAKDRKKQAKQVEDYGQADPNHPMGKITVGAWIPVADDGDPACTYDFDAFLESKKLDNAVKQPAGPVAGDARLWSFEFDAPWSGNHGFELLRYRTCADGKREFIGTAAIEAVLSN